MRIGELAILACVIAALAVSPAAAGPAEDVAQQTASIEAALSEKDFTTAEELARAALALAEQSLGTETLEVANLNRLLGDALFTQERYAEAEPHYRTALSLRETLLGMSAIDTAVSANDLGLVLKRQQRYADAEPYYREVVAIREAAQGRTHPDTAKAAFWVSRLFDAAGQYADAARAMADAVARAVSAFGPTDPTTLEWMGERAAMLHDANDLEAAEPAYLEVIGLGATVFAANDPVLASARQGLANLYAATSREVEAVPLYRAALAAREASFGPDDAATISSADRLARVLWATEQIAEAETLFQRVLAAREQSDGMQSRTVADALRWIGRAASAQNRRADAEIALKRALAISEQTDGPEGVLTAFDLIALGQLYSGQQRFTEARPLLQRPALQTVAEVQTKLGENEVLLFFADTNKLGGTDFETYLWAIPKTGEPRWVRLPRTTGELSGAVRELRNGMGVGTATRGPARVGGGSGDSTDRVLAAASQLNAALLGQVGDLIANRDLLIVPSKSLAALPFHALVSALPEATSKDRYREANWLVRDHAITILPSVASLAPVPQADTAEVERVAYLAFANPLLRGGDGSDRRAFERGGCAPATSPATMVAAVEMPALSTLFRGGSADVAAVRALPPLPETTDEVCAIATLLGTGPEALRLGAEATETTLKLLSTSGELMRPRVLHFATHGLVSGELSGLVEPAIVLTPPETAGPDDDGLLTASEVTTLKLDADWVILSACNTASSDGGGEALSGLARAFFYAGARALMVSHWPVSSDAAVRLASGAVAALAGDPTISRAEALRRAVLAEIDRGGASADPANWAPFILRRLVSAGYSPPCDRYSP